MTAKRNQERVKSILLLAIPDEYLLKFHKFQLLNLLWAAIKSSLDKAYDRFQKLISQLEVHAAPVSKEDINQKFLRSLPPLWSQIALIMRNKQDIGPDEIDDLYNTLELAFLSSKNTSSTNEVSTDSGNFRGEYWLEELVQQVSVSITPGADEVVCSFSCTSEQRVLHLYIRVQRFIQKTGLNLDFKGKQPVTFNKSNVECYNCHRKGHFAKECKSGRNQEKRSYGDNGRRNATTNESSLQALVAQDGILQKQQPEGIFISQDKYVADILKKFDFCSIKPTTTPIASNKHLVKDEDSVDVDVHVYRSMIGSLMYLNASRPDIMFAVCACARFQVTPKASHLNEVKRIFRYLKHQPKLGLWYPRDSPFGLEAFSNSDYGGANLDRKSTIGGCQFLGRRLISWQCKKQTIVANSTTEAEYVAAANCYGQVLWIQNQMMDYGFNFMNTKIHIDNESTICIVKNHVYHSRTKHIEILHHFIRDCFEKRLIDVIKIHTDANVGRQISRLRATYGAEFLSVARLVNTARPTLSTAWLGKFGAVRQIRCCQANLVLPSKFGAARQKFVLFVTAVVVIEASIRSSLLFNDADGPACLTDEAIFKNLALMGYEAKGEGSGEPTEPQLAPSPTQPNIRDQPLETSSSHATTQDSRDSLEETNGNEGDQVRTPHDSPLLGGHISDRAEGALNLQELSVLCTNLSNRDLVLESIKDAQAAEISALKSRIKKLEKKCKLSISYHMALLKSVKRLSMKKRFGKKESVSKQGRKKSKPKSTLDDSIVFDDQDANHGMEYMETKEAVDEGRQSGETEEVKLTDDTEVVEVKRNGDKGGNAEELVSTTRPEVSTTRPDIDAARQEDSDVKPRTPPTTTSIFDNEAITMAQTLIKIKEEKAKEKGVSIKDVDDSSRPARSILTLKPLPTIDPKDNCKGVLKESPVKKVKRSDLDAVQIAKDAKISRLVHKKEPAEMEREREERQRHDQASVDYIASLYDKVQAKMDASEELAARLQMEEREMYIIEERSKLLAEFFGRRKKLLGEERVATIRNKPPKRTQLRSLMMTYLKHTEMQIFEEEVPEKPESTKVEVKQEGRKENIRKRSGRRLKMKATKKYKRQNTDFDLEEEEQLRASLKIVPDEQEEIDYEVLGTRVFRANGSSRYIKTFTEIVSRFDRLDFIELHSLVMQRFSTTTPEGIDLVLWGDLRIMFEETADDDIWKNQEK
ncbi:putative ribonuclease H-like domain-containing protein [Tanacetum coccineum]